MKTSREYIETEYGTRHLARIFELNDVESMLDLMQDFSDYNKKQSKASEMMEMLERIYEQFEKDGHLLNVSPTKINQLINEATTLP